MITNDHEVITKGEVITNLKWEKTESAQEQ